MFRMNRVDSLFVVGMILFSVFANFAARADAPLLGRLFFSEEERRQFDRVREEAKKREHSATEKKQGSGTKSFHINGIIMRSDGPDAFWINGAPVSKNDASRKGIHVIEQPDNTLKIGFPCGANDVRVKPGQEVICREDDTPSVR
uniref:Uncharacterized protein n=1 Tax=Candidatus Kentrum sp. UNK TaxID=2126344 RepID=A0A451A0C8_9GAMM|nr:MAG: hypothetical protein BECKUNK1418G_GA0071005_100732 [Candidatus Kentron sp. UNK]